MFFFSLVGVDIVFVSAVVPDLTDCCCCFCCWWYFYFLFVVGSRVVLADVGVLVVVLVVLVGVGFVVVFGVVGVFVAVSLFWF